MRTGIALGSNIGDRLTNLRSARKGIVELPGVSGPVLSSSVYETDPIGCEAGAAKFLNAVIEFEFQDDPADLLEELIRIEESLGRRRDHARNVSRAIDLDLLYSGDSTIESAKLRLPHPRIVSRGFVLQPLADIRPDLVLPNQTKTVADLLADLRDSGKVLPFIGQW